MGGGEITDHFDDSRDVRAGEPGDAENIGDLLGVRPVDLAIGSVDGNGEAFAGAW